MRFPSEYDEFEFLSNRKLYNFFILFFFKVSVAVYDKFVVKQTKIQAPYNLLWIDF